MTLHHEIVRKRFILYLKKGSAWENTDVYCLTIIAILKTAKVVYFFFIGSRSWKKRKLPRLTGELEKTNQWH